MTKSRKEAFWSITEKDSVNLERYVRKTIKVLIAERKLINLSPKAQRKLSVHITEDLISYLRQGLQGGVWDKEVKEILLK